MNMTVSTDLMSATISAPQSVSRPPPPTGAGPTGNASSTETMGGSLPGAVKDSLLAAASELKSSGASSEEIKSLVDSELGAESGGGQRSGLLVDMMS